MTLKALIFDFDGLIIDTEMPEYNAWQEVYRGRGLDLPLSDWAKCVGASFNNGFDPYTDLAQRSRQPVDTDELRQAVRARSTQLLQHQRILPGVVETLDAARNMGLPLAIASSSKRDWINHHLTRLDLLSYFDVICTGDEVPRVKPDPALYRLATHRLGIQPDEGVAFEDSPNGVAAAKEAGLYCVAIPNDITGQLNLQRADIILPTMSSMPLTELLVKLAQ